MKILIIDDDDLSLSAFNRSLSVLGHDCFLYNNAEEAVKFYDPAKFDIVISDVKMKPMSGIEVLKNIRDKNESAIVILVTGYYEMNEALFAIKHKANAFFTKPVNMKELAETLDTIEDEMNQSKMTKAELDKMKNEYDNIKKKYDDLKTKIKNAK